jgi:3-hydroxybutyryl-CoA dehydrogenase
MKFADEIRMIPLPVLKEKAGYLLNSMLIPFLFAGLDLYVNGVSDPESIDKARTLGTGAPEGPFHIVDVIGLKTTYNVVSMYTKIPSCLAPYNFKGIAKMLQKYMDEGKTGKAAGVGFFTYKK